MPVKPLDVNELKRAGRLPHDPCDPAATEEFAPGNETARATTDAGAPNPGDSENSEPGERATPPGLSPFVPFPVEVLPAGLGEFVTTCARSIGCDPVFPALPALSALAAAIGNTREIELKDGWTEPPILWTAIIGESGDGKTPALDAAVEPFQRHESDALKRYRERRKKFDRDVLEYERTLNEWKRSKGGGDPPGRPEEPKAEAHVVRDTTTEGVAKRLAENPRGLLLARDELRGWIASFDRYAGKTGGGDQAAWLEMYSGKPLRRDRAGSETLFVKRASVCICGGIQPGVFARTFDADKFESGTVARMFLAMPPRSPLGWSDSGLDLAVRSAYSRTFDKLLSLSPAAANEDGYGPLALRLSAEAKSDFVDFIDAHAMEGANAEGPVAAAWSKLRGGAARLALIHYLTRWAEGEAISPEGPVDSRSMRAGIALARWFWQESRRVYAIIGESESEANRRKLVEFLRTWRRPITSDELRKRRYGKGEGAKAEAALEDLVRAELGRWIYSPSNRSGPRTRYFTLNP